MTKKIRAEAEFIRLDELEPGESGSVAALLDTGSMRRRLLDIGIAPGTAVECVGRSPLGDPSAYLIRGAVIAVRSEDAEKIILRRGGRAAGGAK